MQANKFKLAPRRRKEVGTRLMRPRPRFLRGGKARPEGKRRPSRRWITSTEERIEREEHKEYANHS